MKTKIIFIASLILSFWLPESVSCQDQGNIPVDKKFELKGKREVDQKSKKKIMASMNIWVSGRLEYPPMVFSVIETGKDSLVLKAVTEVPSSKNIHPISFKLILIPKKKSFDFYASGFYFEDIRLSLESWLDKYSVAENERNQRNVELITKGIESHIFMSMNLLVEKINLK